MIVISHIFGDLYNQLFQYTSSLVFVYLFNAKLCFDLSFFSCSYKKNIVANRLFNWQGIWLNISSNKIVIAPRLFFIDRKQSKDILTEKWI